MTLTLDQICSQPLMPQYITQKWIPNRVGGDLTSASKWTGPHA